MSGRRVHITTYGCQMNENDSALIAGQLAEAGYTLTDNLDDADVALFNTCSVRDLSERKAVNAIRRLQRRKATHPEFRIGVGGCMVQRRGDAVLDALPHVDFAWGTNAVHEVVRLLDQAGGADPVLCIPDHGHDLSDEQQMRPVASGPSGQVSVMRGCDKRCAFCIVPTVRGPQRSKRLGDVLGEVHHLVEAGAKEIMLVGQNVNAWGKDLDAELSFADLLAAVDAVDGVERVRFTTNHPKDMSPAMIRAMAELPTVCEHIHLPVQSGSDRILKRMSRNYRRAFYEALVAQMKDAIPDLAITTDIIVGFPGETDADLEATKSLMDAVPFDGAFIFKYSPRPGTKAHDRTDEHVPEPEIEARHRYLLEHQKTLSSAAVAAQRGTKQEVLVTEHAREPGYVVGKTRHMKSALVPGGAECLGRLLPIHVKDVTDYTLLGERIDTFVVH